MTPSDADVFVDITDTVDRKIEALLSHVSQMPDPAGIEARIRGRGVTTAESAGLPRAPGRGISARRHAMSAPSADGARTRLLLVRHGESTWNADGRWQGQADPPSPSRVSNRLPRPHTRVDHRGRDLGLRPRARALHCPDRGRRAQRGRTRGPCAARPAPRARDAGEWEGDTAPRSRRVGRAFSHPAAVLPGYEGDDSLVARTLETVDAIGAAAP